MAIDDFTIERKTGDVLLISGQLAGDNLPADPAWVGATAKINIADVNGTVVVDHVAVTLDVTTKLFDYVGAPIMVAGKYFWEIEVTFLGYNNPITWPNNRSMILYMRAQVA